MNTNLYIANTLWKKDRGDKRLGKTSSLIAGVSVALSLIVMILSIAISDGFKFEIREKAMGLSGEIIINSPGFDMNANQYPINKEPSYLKKLLEINEIETIQPFAYRSGMIKNADQIQGIILKGVDSCYNWKFYKSVLYEGRVINVSDTLARKEIIMSKRLALMMGYKTGDDVLVYFIDNSIRVKKFRLTGLYDAQLEEIDMSLIITDLTEIQKLNYWSSNQVSGLEIRLKRSKDIDVAGKKIEDVIYSSSDKDDSSVSVNKISDMFPHLFDWLRLLDFNVLVVLVLMIAVAGFNMISGLLIMLFEKISMIGLLKALGMRSSDIHKIFLYRAGFIVIKAMFIGNIVAFGICYIQQYFKIITLDPTNYFVKYVPIHIDIIKILLLNATSFALIMLFLLLPSIFISKISPDRSIKMK